MFRLIRRTPPPWLRKTVTANSTRRLMGSPVRMWHGKNVGLAISVQIGGVRSDMKPLERKETGTAWAKVPSPFP